MGDDCVFIHLEFIVTKNIRKVIILTLKVSKKGRMARNRVMVEVLEFLDDVNPF